MAATLVAEKSDTTGFGERLKVLRVAAGLTQEALAELVGMQPQNITRLERGRRSPSWETVLKFADALGVDVGEFRKEE